MNYGFDSPSVITAWDVWGGIVVLPFLILLALPAFRRQSRREGDPRVYRVLVLALLAKMATSVFRYWHAFYVVGGADARQFDGQATIIATRFLHGNYATGLNNVRESNFMRFFTALIYTAVHPSALAGFFIYAWLAFWGTFFFYRAFVLAVPDGDRRAYARWLFFLPSLLFWPSSIGKESWMLFGLGIAAFGAAKMLMERTFPGIVVAATGLALAGIVRPPIAVVMGGAIVVAALVRKRRSSSARRSPLGAIATVVLLAVAVVALAGVWNRYLTQNGLRGQGIDHILTRSARETAQGDSEFAPTPATSPPRFALAVVSVLFRPFPFEANNLLALITSLEEMIILIWSLVRWRSIVQAIRSFRRSPYAAVAILYTAGSIAALSAVANFGIVARQRTLIFPMYFVLVCFAARTRKRPTGVTTTDVSLETRASREVSTAGAGSR
jgi:hypothetical protein